MDGHWAAELLGFSGLQLGIYGFFTEDRWCSIWRLTGVPFVDLGVDLRWQRFLEPPLADGPFEGTLQRRFAEAGQRFFAFSRSRIRKTSCTMPLLFSGDSAISSEAAATTIQNAG
jgi:hypothetical protein